jgi:predicted  nucleic acid-binding Zn-ribbon protein
MSVLPIKEYSKGKSNRREISVPKEELEYFKEEKNIVEKFKKQFNHENNDKIVTYVKVLKIGEYEDLKKDKKQLKLKKTDYETFEKQNVEIANLNKTIEDKINKLSDLTKHIHKKDQEIANLNKDINIFKESLKDTAQIENEVSKLTKENTDLISKNNYQTKKIKKLKNKLQTQNDENKKLSLELKTIEQNKTNELQKVEKIYKEQFNQLQERYDQLNKDKEKCISLNSSLITDFKHILNFGFLDLLRKKHKTTIEAAIKKEIPDKNKEFKTVLIKNK